MRAAVACAVLLAACGGDPTPISDAEPVRIVPGRKEVALGRAFPLAVVQMWRKGETPDDVSLAPLSVRLEGTTRREQGALVEETRRYTAYAFTRGEVDFPAIDEPLRVRPALDPTAPGPAELPPAELPAPFVWWPWALAAGAVALLVLAVRRRPRAPAPEPIAAPDAPDPRAEALAALAALRGGVDYERGAAILRAFAGAPAHRTTEELAPPLQQLLGPCDRVKFARAAPDAATGARWLDDAERFVREAA